jgi:hypothetical protein
MFNVISPRCIHENCDLIPNYNKKGEKKGLYCSEHKLDFMVDIKHDLCMYENCEIRGSYNYKGNKKGLYCSEHRLDNMYNVISPRCIHENCDVIPTYNNKGEKNGLYCFTHKLDFMVDVKHDVCMYENCDIRPLYNYEGEKKGLYCFQHKKESMLDVVSKMCKTHMCQTRVKKKYDGYCLYCYINLFPEKPVSRNYKTKEYAVVEFIKTSFPELSWVSDKKITDGCSKRRPDLFLDLGYQILIIEIDENQHLDYDCSCENKRIMELSQDVGHKPIVFIRFNPDEYYNDEIVISSCWGTDKKGISVVKKSKAKEWEKRLNTLKEQVIYWINPDNITTKMVETIQLFFDWGGT